MPGFGMTSFRLAFRWYALTPNDTCMSIALERFESFEACAGFPA